MKWTPRDARGLDDVLVAVNVRLDALGGVVFCGGHLFQGSGMNDVVDAVHRLLQPLGIPDIADEIAHAVVVVHLLHFKQSWLSVSLDQSNGWFIKD